VIKFELTEPASLFPLCDDATIARYWITFLVFSVLPAPDSPLLNKECCHTSHKHLHNNLHIRLVCKHNYIVHIIYYFKAHLIFEQSNSSLQILANLSADHIFIEWCLIDTMDGLPVQMNG